MAKPNRLPIYREATILVQQLHDSTRKAPRDLRFTLVQNLLGQSVDTCVDIVSANRAIGVERAGHLGRLADRIVRIEVLLAVANSYLGAAQRHSTFRLRSRWSTLAAKRGLVPTPDRSKMLQPPPKEPD